MRSIRLLAATTFILFGVSACGDDDGGNGTSQDPVAAFSGGPCTVGVACTFTDASSDPQGATTITTRSWDLNGDGTEDLGGNQITASYTYQTAGTFPAKLTVTDNSGNTDDAIVSVTVNPGTTNNVAPTASFTAPPGGCAVASDCLFTDTSMDTDGTIAGWSWNFGDGSLAATEQHPVHQYQTAGVYTVALTVTDNGGATATTSQQVTVSDVAAQDCVTTGNIVDCTITMVQRSTITLTLTGIACELTGNRLTIPPPQGQTAFFNLCSRTVGEQYTIVDGAGAPLAFDVGAQVRIRFTQGTPGVGDPAVGPPAARFEGTAPTWSISIDDGGNPTGAGEPDFSDIVVQVQATPAP